jgi:hypothetical protein
MKIRRRKFLAGLALAPAAATLVIASSAHAEHYPAKLCGSCSFGSKGDDCAKCGKWRGSTKVPARLCGDHGFGSKGDNCASCGNWVGSSKALAYLCGDCGFGSKKDNCMKCGKWAP